MKGSARIWQHATRQLANQLPDHEEVRIMLEAIAYLEIPVRKELLRISRCQRSLSSNSFLRAHTKSAKPSALSYKDAMLLDKFGTTSSDLIDQLSDRCHKDIAFSAIINVLARSAPFLNVSSEEVEENRQESWAKEYSATQGCDRPPVLNYAIWFSPDPSVVNQALSPYLPPAPGHNTQIRESFKEWRSRISGSTLYPQIQNGKSLSRMTARLYRTHMDGYESATFETNITSADLERLYATEGVQLGGCCEMRQAWKYNDLVPRTYFAQGGETFHASKYVRDIANSLTNSFSATNFISRFSYNDLMVTNEHTTFIYDYSSFTSNLTELKYFLDALADYTEDTEVTLIDSRYGPSTYSLGQLIREYNRTCNQMGRFQINRWLECVISESQHGRAGFLGVYGNIAFSTCLHGLHAVQLAGDNGDAKCVGDDVYASIAFRHPEERVNAIEAVQSIGDANRSKVRWWRYRTLEEEGDDDRTWPYTKRPFDRLQSQMILEPAIFLPIFGEIVSISDDVRQEPKELYARVKLLATQTFAAIRQCRVLYPPLTVAQTVILESYLQTLYTLLGAPHEGRLPAESFVVKGQEISGLFLPRVTDDFLLRDPWDLLEERFGSTSSMPIRVPVMSKENIVLSKDILNNPGIPYDTCLDRMLAYFRDMEWVKVERLYEIRFFDFDEYRSFYDALFAGDLYPLYRVVLRDRYPSWLEELVV